MTSYEHPVLQETNQNQKVYFILSSMQFTVMFVSSILLVDVWIEIIFLKVKNPLQDKYGNLWRTASAMKKYLPGVSNIYFA